MAIERLDSAHFAPAKNLKYHDVLGLFDYYEGLAFRDNLILVGPKGIGKAQPLTAQVLTPNGFVSMGDMEVGMEVVSHDGAPVKVTGVFPQGKKPVFRVTMSDGAETECCGEHLWETLTLSDAYAGRQPAVRSLHEIRETLYYQETLSEKMTRPTRNHRVPIAEAVLFQARGELTIHPYLMGVLLGDGAFRGLSVQVTNSEHDIRERCRRLLPGGDNLHFTTPNTWTISRPGTTAPSEVRKALESYGLRGKKSVEKFIPTPYLFASIEDRQQLLAGLLDTDGSVMASGQRVEFGTSSPQLHEDVLFLARSLGAVVRHSNRIPTYAYLGEKREGSRAWRHSIYFPDGYCPVTSGKHTEKWATEHTPYYRTIEDIEPVGEVECQCISVGHPRGLYVTDDFIVTHNTLSVAAYAAKLDCPIVTFDCSEDARRSNLVGNFVLRGDETPFILGPATTAFEVANEVGQCILVCEEINALTPQLQKSLNSLTDYRRRIDVPEAKRTFQLEPGAKLWVVGTMNTAVYGGIYMLNEDLKSRFNLLPLDYPAVEKEVSILEDEVNGQLKDKRVVIDGLMRLAQETRQGELAYALSTRDLVQILHNAEAFGVKKALFLATGKFEDEDRDTVVKWIQSIFGV